MNYYTVLIMYGGLPHDILLVMDEDEEKCKEDADAFFEKECGVKGLKFTDDEMEAWKEAGESNCFRWY